MTSFTNILFNEPGEFKKNPLYSEMSESDIQSILSSTGYEIEISEESYYVVHTSTIPFLGVCDPLLRKGKLQHVDHDCIEHCMINKPFPIKEICPCRDRDNSDDLIHICFGELMLDFKKFFKGQNPSYDRTRLMFCKDSTSILSESYCSVLREATQETGFSKVKTFDAVIAALECTYWFRKGDEKTKKDLIRRLKDFSKGDIEVIKTVIKQSIYTVDGLLIKFWFAIPEYHFDYVEIADKSFDLFRSLVFDYTMKVKVDQNFKPIERTEKTSVLLDIKKFIGFSKENFHSKDMDRRLSINNYEYSHKCLERFIKPYIDKIYRIVGKDWCRNGHDHTMTAGFIWRFSIISQGRVIGYLPKDICEAKAARYREEVICRPLGNYSKEHLNKIYFGVQDALIDHIPRGFLTNQNQENEKELFDTVFSKLDFRIKSSASYHHTLLQGGRYEDARLLFNWALKTKTPIPIYDLYSLEVKKEFIVDEQTSYLVVCFWVSLQIAINALSEINSLSYCDFYKKRYRNWEYPKQSDFFHARILHIMEPGKVRNLTKSTSEYTWVLSPYGKLMQSTLAFFSAHKVGLEQSSHGWKFLMRITPETDESAAFFSKDGSLREEVETVFSDWTESTDFLDKRIGLRLLLSFSEYIGIPKEYGRLCNTLVALPQRVKEYTNAYSESYDSITSKRYEFEGSISNGFMMGNPVTKPLLHICHIYEEYYATEILRTKYRSEPFKQKGRTDNFHDIRKAFIRFMADKSIESQNFEW